MSSSTSDDGEKYLARIGHTGGVRAGRELLDELLRLHVATIPFENLDTYAPAPGRTGVSLDPQAISAKLLGAADGGQRRGGYCFEHAALLRMALPSYGFDVRPALGRVYVGGGAAPLPKTHNVTVVRLGDRELLADPGFGGMTPTASLDLEPTGTPQRTPHGTYRVVPMARAGVDAAAAADLDVMVQLEFEGTPEREWRNLYGLDLGPAVPADFVALNWYVATSPASPFVTQLAAALAPEGRRITVADTVTRIRQDGATTARDLTTDTECAAALDAVGVDVDEALLTRVWARLSEG